MAVDFVVPERHAERFLHLRCRPRCGYEQPVLRQCPDGESLAAQPGPGLRDAGGRGCVARDPGRVGQVVVEFGRARGGDRLDESLRACRVAQCEYQVEADRGGARDLSRRVRTLYGGRQRPLQLCAGGRARGWTGGRWQRGCHRAPYGQPNHPGHGPQSGSSHGLPPERILRGISRWGRYMLDTNDACSKKQWTISCGAKLYIAAYFRCRRSTLTLRDLSRPRNLSRAR